MKQLFYFYLVAVNAKKWRPKAANWVVGALLVLLGFPNIGWRLYRSAKQESLPTMMADSLTQMSIREVGEAKYFDFASSGYMTFSDSLAQWLATQAAVVVKSEPELALKLIKEAYRITNQCPPVEVRMALAALFNESLNRLPVLYYQFDVQSNPKKLIYSEAHQAYLIYFNDGQALKWSSTMRFPLPYPLTKKSSRRASPNDKLSVESDQYKISISPSKQYMLHISKKGNENAYIKNQEGEILGFFSAQEQIRHACFGKNDNQILTISKDGKCKLWALDNFGLREENPYDHDWGLGHPSYIKTERGIELLNHKGETRRMLNLEIPPDQLEVAMIGERMMSFKTWSKILYYWDLEGNLLRRIEHQDRISWGSISSDGIFGIVLTHEEPTSGSVYDLRTGEIYPTLDTLLTEGLLVAAFSPGMPYMITHVDYGLKLGLWDTKGNKVNEFSPNGLVEMIYFSPNGTYFHTQSNGKKGQIWDMEGNLLGTTDKNIKLLRFTPDESRIYYIIPNEDSDIMISKKRSLPTLSFHYQYLMEQLDLAPLTADEKARFGL